MAVAEIQIEILEDGTVRWQTGRIPGEHHDDADLLIAELEKALGGEIQKTTKVAKDRQTHHHTEGHIHQHEH